MLSALVKVQSRLDRDVLKGILGDKEEDFEAFERAAEREFRYWAASKYCDTSHMQDFAGMQDLALRSVLEAGDVFVLRRFTQRPGARYGTCCSWLKQTASAILTGRWIHQIGWRC